jgi:hypothetical protein
VDGGDARRAAERACRHTVAVTEEGPEILTQVAERVAEPVGVGV